MLQVMCSASRKVPTWKDMQDDVGLAHCGMKPLLTDHWLQTEKCIKKIKHQSVGSVASQNPKCYQ